MAKTRNSADRELSAMGAILKSLEGLDGESIQRVLDYVFDRLSISAPRQHKSVASVSSVSTAADTQNARRASIRDLKEEKLPESSNQMAALVAYYLSEVAGEGEFKDAVNAADIAKYFKQAGFQLPKSMHSTLPNAAAAGYFDSVGNGLYRLNAVGYNLIAHGLPRSHSASTKKKSKKGTKTEKPNK